MRAGTTLVALTTFGLFGYLVLTGEQLALSFFAATLASLLTAPTLLVLFDGPRCLASRRFISGWLTALVLCQAIYLLLAGQLPDYQAFAAVILAFLLAAVFPAMISSLLPFQPLWSVVVLAAIWIPFDHRVSINFWPWPSQSLGYPFAAFMVSSLSLIIFVKIRPLKPLIQELPWHMRRVDLLKGLCAFLLLTAMLLPLALATDFVRYTGLPYWHRPPVLFLGIFFTIALPEELVFRGILQNLLAKHTSTAISVATSALLFGLTHWNNGTEFWDWRYLSLATLAGLGYGLSYFWSRNLFVPVLVHTLVDTTWISFFK